MGQKKIPTPPPNHAEGASLPITEAEALAALAELQPPAPLEAPVVGEYDAEKGGRPTTHGFSKRGSAIKKAQALARKLEGKRERKTDPKTKKPLKNFNSMSTEVVDLGDDVAPNAFRRRYEIKKPEGLPRREHYSNRFSAPALTGERMPPKEFSDELKWKYLDALAVCGLVGKSAALAGISTSSVELHRKGDKNFALLEREAKQAYTDSLITEAHRRAVVGVQKKVYQRGEQVMDACEECWGTGVELPKDRALAQIPFEERKKLPRCKPCRGTGNKGPAIVTEHSDRLLESMLKAHDNRFRDKQVTEVNINGGVLFAPPAAGGTSKDFESKWGGADLSKEPIDVTPEKK